MWNGVEMKKMIQWECLQWKYGIGKITIYSRSDLQLYMVMKWLKFMMKMICDYMW